MNSFGKQDCQSFKGLAVLLTTLSLILSACVTTPDLRPDSYLKSETLLQEGLTAYRNDNFTEAQQKFSRALQLYQSFDNYKGIALARMNLVETALANSDFATAQSYLTQLKQTDLEPVLQRKRIVLEAKFQFEQQHYAAALNSLKPLLSELDGLQKLDEEQLSLLAMQVRLEVLILPATESKTLAKFSAALAENPSPHYQALLNRSLAVVAVQRKDYQTATNLLTTALAYYKEQANRRSIAACLEELADVEIAQQHFQPAKNYLERALVIRQWLKNDLKIAKLKEKLKLK
jgi:tetratricopeptide (TPR) repeat protein